MSYKSQKIQPSHFYAVKNSTRAFLRVTDAESTAIGHACIQSKTSSVFLFEVSALMFIENSGFKMEIEWELFIESQQQEPEMAGRA